MSKRNNKLSNSLKNSKVSNNQLTSKDDVALPSLFKLITTFISLKQAQGCSERTILDYERNLGNFYLYCDSDTTNDKLLQEKVIGYLSQYSNKAPATFNIPYQNLNAFFNWCTLTENLPYNPLRLSGLKKKKDDGKIRHSEPDEIELLLKACDRTTYAGNRDRALILLTLDTGIRPSEAFSLRQNDIDFHHNRITIRRETAKTRVERQLPLSGAVASTLKDLIDLKPEGFSDDLIFYSYEGNPLNTRSWGQRLQYYSKKIRFNITPYSLRHTFAIQYIRNGGNAFYLQYELGHSELKMTKRYVKLALTDVEKEHNMHSPAAHFIKRASMPKRARKLR